MKDDHASWLLCYKGLLRCIEFLDHVPIGLIVHSETMNRPTCSLCVANGFVPAFVV
jgi:hypothetical protein